MTCQKNSNPCKGSGHELRNGIIIALVTGAVTAIGSYFLVDWRLGKEHDYWFQELEARLPKEHQYWIEKQEHLRNLKIMDEQLALIKGLTMELGSLQSLRWQTNQLMIQYLVLEMLADRFGSDHEKDEREKQEEGVKDHSDQMEANFHRVQAHFMMARMIFQNWPSEITNDPLYAFGYYVQSADYVVTAVTAPKVKIALASLPELVGKPDIRKVRVVAHEYFLKTTMPGHQRFTVLANNLLQHLAKELRLEGE